MEQNNHYFYVVECKDCTYYAGYTNNLQKRISVHNEGKGAKYTRGRGPVKLVFSKKYATKSEALKAEYAFKRLKRSEKQQYIREQGQYVAAEKL